MSNLAGTDVEPISTTKKGRAVFFKNACSVPQSTYSICLDYHSVCPLVRVGTPTPYSCKRVCPPPPGTKGAYILRVQQCLSPCPNCPPPPPRNRVCPPPEPKAEGTHSPAGEGVGKSQFGRLEKKPNTLSTPCLVSIPNASGVSLYVTVKGEGARVFLASSAR